MMRRPFPSALMRVSSSAIFSFSIRPISVKTTSPFAFL